MNSLYKHSKSLIGTFLRRTIRYSRFFMDLQATLSLHPQEQMLHDIMEYLASTSFEGDYLEFGVYEGWSLIAAYKFSRLFRLEGMNFIAFDSFQGLPGMDSPDETPYPQYQQGDYACDQHSFERNLKHHGIPMDRVHIVPGWFKDTLHNSTKNQLGLEQAAVAWIDCDLYTSAAAALTFLTDLVQDGTIVVFDDWLAFRGDPQRGEQRAFQEWLDRNPAIRAVEFGRMGWHGKAFILQSS
jgi:O-methyltransferase